MTSRIMLKMTARERVKTGRHVQWLEGTVLGKTKLPRAMKKSVLIRLAIDSERAYQIRMNGQMTRRACTTSGTITDSTRVRCRSKT
jgi:hypothetical protein